MSLGSEAKAKPWGYRPGKHGGAAAYDGTPRVPLNAGPAAAADPLAVPFY